MNNYIFKNPEFEKRLENVFTKISNYFSETNYTLEKLKFKELVLWHDLGQSGERVIYAHNECPTEIRETIDRIIKEEFNSNL